MSTRVLSPRFLEQAADIANIGDCPIRDDYSGRGMYGEQCVGIDLPGQRELYRFLIALGALMTEDASWRDDPEPTADAMDLANAAITDSLGLGVILYFPGWTVRA
jgi:hypothetical protein